MFYRWVGGEWTIDMDSLCTLYMKLKAKDQIQVKSYIEEIQSVIPHKIMFRS